AAPPRSTAFGLRATSRTAPSPGCWRNSACSARACSVAGSCIPTSRPSPETRSCMHGCGNRAGGGWKGMTPPSEKTGGQAGKYDPAYVAAFYDRDPEAEWLRLVRSPLEEIKLHVHEHYLRSEERRVGKGCRAWLGG